MVAVQRPHPEDERLYSPYATYDTYDYSQKILDLYFSMIDLKISLRKSFNQGQSNREEHHMLISIALELWSELYPHVMDTELEDDFKKFLPFWMSQGRLFFEEDYEHFIWYLCFLVNIAFERLGFKNIK